MNAQHDQLSILLFLIAALTANIYLILYSFRPWRSTGAGRALMTKTVGNVILLNMILFGLIWPDYPYRWVVRNIGLIVFDAGLIYLTIVLIRTPREPRWKDRRPEKNGVARPDVQDA